MSNLSIKEQLESFGLSSNEPERPKHNKKNSPAPTHKSANSNPTDRSDRSNRSKPLNPHATKPEAVKKPKPVWLEQAQYGVELLKAHFPNCFRELKDTQPLKIGIKQDLVKHLGSREDIVISDKACMVSSLAYYVNSPAYHKHIVEGTTRVDLEGNPSGVVSAEEAKYSQECRKTKLDKKKFSPQNKAPKTVDETSKG